MPIVVVKIGMVVIFTNKKTLSCNRNYLGISGFNVNKHMKSDRLSAAQ